VRSRITLSVSNIFWVAEGSSARSGLPPTKYGLYHDRYTRFRSSHSFNDGINTLTYGTGVEEVASANYIDSVFQKIL
jgi:hypothetical protein